jgi:diaminopimelate epimerase
VLRIETGAGVLRLELEILQDRVERVCVDMGPPVLEPERIPARLIGNPIADQDFEILGRRFQVTCLSMGNPHCVVFVDSATDAWVLELGPAIESDPRFPARVNVEFVEVLSRSEVRQRTWERGSGETWACGTGASAVCVAGVLTGRTDRQIVNHLLGGDLELRWSEQDHHVYMTGPAVEVFGGDWPE